MASLPIKFQELLQLNSLGVTEKAITFNSCVRSISTQSLSLPLANPELRSRH